MYTNLFNICHWRRVHLVLFLYANLCEYIYREVHRILSIQYCNININYKYYYTFKWCNMGIKYRLNTKIYYILNNEYFVLVMDGTVSSRALFISCAMCFCLWFVFSRVFAPLDPYPSPASTHLFLISWNWLALQYLVCFVSAFAETSSFVTWCFPFYVFSFLFCFVFYLVLLSFSLVFAHVCWFCCFINKSGLYSCIFWIRDFCSHGGTCSLTVLVLINDICLKLTFKIDKQGNNLTLSWWRDQIILMVSLEFLCFYFNLKISFSLRWNICDILIPKFKDCYQIYWGIKKKFSLTINHFSKGNNNTVTVHVPFLSIYNCAI